MGAVRDFDTSGSTSGELAEQFRALWNCWHERVRRYLARRCRGEDLDDVLAATFTTCWRRIRDVPGGEDALWWLLAVARHEVANQHRSNRRRARLAERTARLHNDVTLDAPAEADRVVIAALDALSSRDREVLTLSFWDELSVAEIAQVLGISAATTYKRLSRAQRRFEEIFRDLSKTDEVRTLPV